MAYESSKDISLMHGSFLSIDGLVARHRKSINKSMVEYLFK